MDNIELIKSLPVERFIMKFHTDEGVIEVETTKAGAIFLLKLLSAHKKAIKNGEDGLYIEVETKKKATSDDDIVIEKFSERFEDITGAIKEAMGSGKNEDDRMYL